MTRFKTAIFCCLITTAWITSECLAQNLIQRVNAPVFKKLHRGVNVDTALPSSGVWPKVQHEAALFDAVAKAGFTSVRVFMPFGASIEETERQIVGFADAFGLPRPSASQHQPTGTIAAASTKRGAYKWSRQRCYL